MNNRPRRVLICLLAVWVSTTICSFGCKKVSYHDSTTHSSEKNSPHSVLEGRTIRVKPYDATFEIPESWLSSLAIPGEPSRNLYLSWDELDYLPGHDGGDAEDAEVINSVLLFQDCAAHVGDKAWGNHLWNDLQGRVYITDLAPSQVAARVEKEGLAKASKVFESASVNSGKDGDWDRRTLDILDAPANTDFILGKRLDFYYHSFGNKTVVFVFLHAGGFDETINGIVNSFKWPA
jgi:hypothetical protein